MSRLAFPVFFFISQLTSEVRSETRVSERDWVQPAIYRGVADWGLAQPQPVPWIPERGGRAYPVHGGGHDHEPRPTTPVKPDAPLPPGGAVNDESKMSGTQVASIIRPTSEGDIRAALRLARQHGKKVAVAGSKHSMGGQAFLKDAVLLDMTSYDKMSLEGEILTVQAGATWLAVQKFLDPKGLSVDIMQSVNHPTVGGAFSVNAHGNNPNSLPFASTVQSVTIMTADGTIKTASREENPELFRLAAGGYGLLGVVLELKIKVRPNEDYQIHSDTLDYKEFPAYFEKHLANNPKAAYDNIFLSISPGSLLEEMLVMRYEKTGAKAASGFDEPMNPFLMGVAQNMFRFAQKGDMGKRVLWFFMKWGQKFGQNHVSRNQAMNLDSSVYTDTSDNQVLIIQEYFVPRDRWAPFVDSLRSLLKEYQVNTMIAHVRGLRDDDSSLLSYARGQERFAVAINWVQRTTPEDQERMGEFARKAADEAIKNGGSYYLPYRMVFTHEQFEAAYPMAREFFDLKRKYDPGELFSNGLYSKYGPR